jgi:hypothetical protein
MGGTTSRFAETDWDAVNGGLLTTSKTEQQQQTLDGAAAPTEHHTILTLQKCASLVNQRAFEIRDLDTPDAVVLYTSQPIEGTSKWFDLCGGSSTNGEKLFCIQTTDAHHERWDIYTYNRPNWEGQMCEEPTRRRPQQEDDTTNVSLLYRTARMDITWNKNHGNVYKYVKSEDDENPKGVLSTAHSVLQVEEIASVTAQYQSFVPTMENPAMHALLQQHSPLVGYWVWEHTPRRHQMKMHLAKGTDIALHCIVAIMTNMVHVEKNTDDEERRRR